MRRAALALLGVMLAMGVAYADETTTKPSYRVVVDRVDHEPSSLGGTRLQIEFSALTLQGQLIDLSDPKSIKTYLGSSEIKQPFALGTFAGTKDDLAIVFVIQTNGSYQNVLPAIVETLDTNLLAALDENTTRVAVLPYGENIGSGKLTNLKQARTRVTALIHDGTAGDPSMIGTVERALSLLKSAKTEPEGRPLRKIIVVIGDGRDLAADDRARITKLGERASKAGVRIHSLGYSSDELRRPLLALGELSKRSLGTFRWVQRDKQDSWAPAFEQLRDEILKQYVLTYFLGPDDDPSGKKLKVVTVGRVEATSNEKSVPTASCNGEACTGYCTGKVCATPMPAKSRGILGWILLVGGIAVGALLLLAAISWVLSKRAPRIPLPPGMVAPPSKGKMPVPASAPPGHAPPPVAAPAPVAPGPCLMILSGPRAGERLALRNGFLIGKQPGTDLQIDDGFTSSLHAQIAMDHFGNCRIYDQGSTNGTFVNGVRVTEYVLEDGVSMRIGSTELRFLSR